MTTHHFGTDINGGLVFEDPDSAAPGTDVPPRVASGTVRVADGSAADGSQTSSLLGTITPEHAGYWSFTTTDIPSIWIEGEDENGDPQWMGPFYSREYQAQAFLTQAQADALYAGIGSIAPGGAVDSVNTQTGAVVLDAEDVGAVPSSAVSAFGLTLLDDADAATMRGTLQAIGDDDFPLSIDTQLDGDVVTWDDAAQAWVNRQPDVPVLPSYLLRGTVLNPGQSVPSDWPDGAIALVRASAPVLGMTQIGKNGQSTSTSTVAVTLTDAVSVGDFVYVSVTASSPGSVLSTITVTDTGTNTYVLRGQRLQGATIQGQDFSVKATTALAVGDTVTVTLGAAVGDVEVAVSKMTGLLTSSTAFDQSGQASGINVTQVTVNAGGATAQPNELAVLSVHWNNGTINDPATWAQAGWEQVGTTQTSPGGTTPKNVAVFVNNLTSVATVSVTPQVSASGVMVALLNTYRAA